MGVTAFVHYTPVVRGCKGSRRFCYCSVHACRAYVISCPFLAHAARNVGCWTWKQGGWLIGLSEQSPERPASISINIEYEIILHVLKKIDGSGVFS